MRRLEPQIRARCDILIVGKPYMDTQALEAAVAPLGGSVRLEFRFVPEAEIRTLFAASDVLVFPYREIDMSGVLMAGTQDRPADPRLAHRRLR